eukprot:6492494-Amphidinium_carterae.1
MTVLQQMGTETSVTRKSHVHNAPPSEPSDDEADIDMSNDEEELPSHEAWKHVETLRQALDDSAFDFSLHFRDAVEGGNGDFKRQQLVNGSMSWSLYCLRTEWNQVLGRWTHDSFRFKKLGGSLCSSGTASQHVSCKQIRCHPPQNRGMAQKQRKGTETHRRR